MEKICELKRGIGNGEYEEMKKKEVAGGSLYRKESKELGTCGTDFRKCARAFYFIPSSLILSIFISIFILLYIYIYILWWRNIP